MPIPVGTAHQVITSLGVRAGETLLLHAGSGAVGQAVIQLARRVGAIVVATASEPNHDRLRELGAIPVAYGPGLADRVRARTAGRRRRPRRCRHRRGDRGLEAARRRPRAHRHDRARPACGRTRHPCVERRQSDPAHPRGVAAASRCRDPRGDLGGQRQVRDRDRRAIPARRCGGGAPAERAGGVRGKIVLIP